MKSCNAFNVPSDIIEGILAKFTWFLATIPFSINEPICITKPFPVNSYVGWTKVFILVLARSFAKFAGKFTSISTRIGYKPILIAKSVTINSYIGWTKSLIFILALNLSISISYCRNSKRLCYQIIIFYRLVQLILYKLKICVEFIFIPTWCFWYLIRVLQFY